MIEESEAALSRMLSEGMDAERGEGYFRHLAEAMPQIVFITDAAGNVEYVAEKREDVRNSAFRRLQIIVVEINPNLVLWKDRHEIAGDGWRIGRRAPGPQMAAG